MASPLPRSVRRALDAMHANVGHGWSVTELAVVAGVSGRTLQRQFLAFLGKAPRAVLRDINFDGARRELLRGSAGARVTDIAQRCGFPHGGRFSVEYRRRYGETPSQTLKRQAVFTAALASMPSFFVPARERPTVAFGAIEAAAEHLEIAGSLGDDLATALTRAGIAVASQPTSARYHLVGAIRGEGAQTRLALRLIDNETGRQLWAYRCDGALRDDHSAEEHLATRIAAALQPCLRSAEIERALRKPGTDLGAHDLALRAMPGVLSLDAEGNARALELLERAMEQDPTHALATALAAWAHVQRVVYHFTTEPQAERARSIELAHKARGLSGDASVLAVLGNALTLLNELDTAELVIRKALSVDGGSAWAWSRSGWLDVYRGDPESAIERLKIALDLAPHDSLAFNSLVGIGCAHFKAGNYAEAARWQERALIEHPSAIWVHRTLCPAYVLSGAKAEARRSLAALRGQYPELTLSEVQRGMPPLPESYCNLVVDALNDVGLPA
ncbi:helix-turn-helix domain-containing protein [Bradyrhizobium sp.]|uniref:helix-turn-helix domain-containing protein n=1 Tax=Bradyrhizobium sp. TaxID=376 RepID=UPI0025C3899F|nr:helix-turn-helix domain-containing protein [Bradyrhizobium sp.]